MKTFFYLRLIVTLFFACIATIIRANDNDNEEVDLYIDLSETVLLNPEEVFVVDTISWVSCDVLCRKSRATETAKSVYCECCLVDSSCTVSDTLSGVGVYLLYYDTTELYVGKKVQRTKDSLFLMYRLNRGVDRYIPNKETSPTPEITVADSLIRRFISPKQVWIKRLTPFVIPYHRFHVIFTISPFTEKAEKYHEEKEIMDIINSSHVL